MKIRLERDGTVFEYTRQPLPEGRFKAVCGLAAAGLCTGLALGVAALCGLPGLIAVGVVTVLAVLFRKMAL